ncbi:MAG TPA: phosphatase PAP2 family protein [Candidatus Paceibacterota bacterium]
MRWIRPFFYELGENVVAIFRGRNLLLIALSVLLTYVLVASGFDWWYFSVTRIEVLYRLLFPAALIGFFIPVLAPFILVFLGARRHDRSLANTGYALGQAGALAWTLSTVLKGFTGRVPPVLSAAGSLTDITRQFRFGFLKGGVFWGWPSSHTLVAFAVAATLIVLYRERAGIRAGAILYALYVGIGVSATIHWFSEFAAGAIIGAVVGSVVGESFRKRREALVSAS